MSNSIAKDGEQALVDVANELASALEAWPRFNSAHEGYAVMLEEVDELWEVVKLKPSARNVKHMRAESIQVAAMALRFAIECCEDTKPGISK